IARAARLEAVAHKGQLVVDLPTFDALPDEIKGYYGLEEVIGGKRDEHFTVRRCTLIDVPEAASALSTPGSRALSPRPQAMHLDALLQTAGYDDDERGMPGATLPGAARGVVRAWGRPLLLGILVLALAGGLGVRLARDRRQAVLPFRNLSGD